MRNALIAAAAALACAPFSAAHTYIQQLRNVDDNGNYVGDWGYPRGYCAKGDTSCDPNDMNNWLLPDPKTEPGLFISDKSILCKATQRRPQQLDADKYPRLKAIPGKHIVLRYSENGHVSQKGPGLVTPDITNKWKPDKGGTVFVYGTTDPKEDEKLVNVLQWTADGKGGDGRGVLLGLNDFDDGRCYEASPVPIVKERAAKSPSYAMGQTGQGSGMFSIPCESNIQLPKDAPVGKPYTIYWVWQWNTYPEVKQPDAPQGKDQYYTTCMDVDVVDTIASDVNATAKFPMPQQDDISVAVKDFKARTADYTDAIKGEVGPYFSSNNIGPTAPGAPASTSVASAPPSGVASPAPSTVASAPAGLLPTDVPPMSTRPGRPQPSQVPSSGNSGNESGGNGSSGNRTSGDVVTVTDIVYITVKGPSVTPTTLATAVVPSSDNAPATSAAPSSRNAPAPTGVPRLTSRPGRPQPQITARAFSPRGRYYRA
ncbi:hypothetical protein BU23DRAFT_524544 [Bimuria novae-zelandiae CBS 107.79]|uniref:DUF7492 domain-containing protein n=1 Tax=Bimuria novae-zelandiae CBS 107.79 TaxID=1447943 RepID=A0A6A5VQR4_9PLEO|nr:hypothetical protein BU23DRAFT_524544 [Bimuria novae-zelandiae CBS 107.79]